MPVLCSWVWRDNVENHCEHDYKNEEETHENLEVTDDTDDHRNNITEALYNTHEKECLKQANNSDDDHCDLGSQLPSVLELAENVEVTQGKVHHVHVVPHI